MKSDEKNAGVEAKETAGAAMTADGLRAEYAHLYAARESAGAAVERLAEILTLLRSENGCPWDKAQTHDSVKQCLIEEAYEAKDAIDRSDTDNLEEELGDVLFQVIFHAGLGAEKGDFDLRGVANREADKMIRRHPHIFSKENAKTIDKVLEKWENVKRQEKGIQSHTERLQEIPKALPALTRSYKIQKRAAGAGFDWRHVEDAFAKVKEEAGELLAACQRGEHAGIRDELGDLLFSVVNVARFLDVDPEDALNGASQKFIERFQYVETAAATAGRALTEMTPDALDVLWEQAKAAGCSSADGTEMIEASLGEGGIS
jgi:tetrapyrrole methylase family protein/MazG family protein